MHGLVRCCRLPRRQLMRAEPAFEGMCAKSAVGEGVPQSVLVTQHTARPQHTRMPPRRRRTRRQKSRRTTG